MAVFFDWVASNLSGVIGLVTLLSCLVILMLSTKFVRIKDFDDLKDKVGGHGTKLKELENKFENVATHKDVASLSKEITSVRGDVKSVATALEGLGDTMQGVQNTLAIITKALIEKGDK